MKTISLHEQEQKSFISLGLEEKELILLEKFAQQSQQGYFSLSRRQLQAKNHVGLLQIGHLRLQILPKAPNGEKLLTELLIYTQTVPQLLGQPTSAGLGSGRLLDLYAEVFSQQLDGLLRKGLLKNYQMSLEWGSRYPSRPHWGKQSSRPFPPNGHFCGYRWELGQNEPLNRLIYSACEQLQRQDWGAALNQRLKRQLGQLSELAHQQPISPADFDRISWNRQNQPYQPLISLCKFILLGLSPQLIAGQSWALGLFVDMSRLFERYVARQLQQGKQMRPSWELYQHKRLEFWKNQPQIPDFILKNTQKSYILDTKWKIPKQGQPNIEDLRQLFVYGVLSEGAELAIIYPRTQAGQGLSADFFQKELYYPQGAKKPRLLLIFIDLEGINGGLNLKNGERILEILEKI